MPHREWFQLRRQSDGLVYTFRRRRHAQAGVGYQRQDRDLWITFRAGLGWVAWDDASDSCSGRPWNTPPHEQGDHPPEGVWVNRLGPKSYVYELIYIEAPGGAS
jgi:hypothetical protein